jgi:hypothetical protein
MRMIPRMAAACCLLMLFSACDWFEKAPAHGPLAFTAALPDTTVDPASNLRHTIGQVVVDVPVDGTLLLFLDGNCWVGAPTATELAAQAFIGGSESPHESVLCFSAEVSPFAENWYTNFAVFGRTRVTAGSSTYYASFACGDGEAFTLWQMTLGAIFFPDPPSEGPGSG